MCKVHTIAVTNKFVIYEPLKYIWFNGELLLLSLEFIHLNNKNRGNKIVIIKRKRSTTYFFDTRIK